MFQVARFEQFSDKSKLTKVYPEPVFFRSFLSIDEDLNVFYIICRSYNVIFNMRVVFVQVCAISKEIGKFNILFNSPVYPRYRVVICPLCYLAVIKKDIILKWYKNKPHVLIILIKEIHGCHILLFSALICTH